MTLDDLMIYYRFKQSNIATAVGMTRGGVNNWFIKGKIPIERQRQIELLTYGALKADDDRETNYSDNRCPNCQFILERS
jgi:hypothetical protein